MIGRKIKFFGRQLTLLSQSGLILGQPPSVFGRLGLLFSRTRSRLSPLQHRHQRRPKQRYQRRVRLNQHHDLQALMPPFLIAAANTPPVSGRLLKLAEAYV